MGFHSPKMRSAAGLTFVACTLLLQPACSRVGSSRDAAAADSLRAAASGYETDLRASRAHVVELTAQLEEQERATKELRAELDQTREVLDYVERQFISLEQGLQSHETKASAVAALAEARLAYDKILRDDPRAASRLNVRAALEKINRSDEMIPKMRYAASVYFAKRSIRLLDDSATRRHVRVVAVDQANMRLGPGVDFEIVGRVENGTVLIELEQKFPWYRVETEQGMSGWIHESLTALR
jgi:hypothetical protein